MNYEQALSKFNTDNTVGILVKTKSGERLLSEYNFDGGCCGCCKGCDSDDHLEVIRVVDVSTMELFYDKESK